MLAEVYDGASPVEAAAKVAGKVIIEHAVDMAVDFAETGWSCGSIVVWGRSKVGEALADRRWRGVNLETKHLSYSN